MRERCAPCAANQTIHLALVQHHGTDEGQAATHVNLGQLLGHAFACGELVIGLPEIAVAVVLLHVDHLVVHTFFESQAEFLNALRNHRWAANQRGLSQTLVHHNLHGTQHAFFFALGKADALFAGTLSGGVNRLHDGARGVDKTL